MIENIKIEVSKEQTRRLTLIEEFDYQAVAKKVSRDMNGLPQSYLKDGVENLKLYYAVALLDPLNAHAVSRPVDPFWHAHVLFTKEYVRFCKAIFGGYVHHQPLDEDDVEAVAQVQRLYDYTLQVYGTLFKAVDLDWWGAQGAPAFGPVCLHQEIAGPKVRAMAALPEMPGMQVRLT